MSGVLGLANYDTGTDSESAGGESPAPGAGEASSAVNINSAPQVPIEPVMPSIVAYDNEQEDEEAADDSLALLDGALEGDDPDAHRTKLSSTTSVRVTKRSSVASQPLPTTEEPDPAPAAEAGEPEHVDEEATEEFTLPPSPKGDVPVELQEKIKKLFSKVKEGYSVNDHIRKAKNFRNPDILEKLVGYFDVDEVGTNYPAKLFDPHGYERTQYYDALEDQRQKWMSRREADKRGRTAVEFAKGGVEGGQTKGPVVEVKAGVKGEGGVRRSKWAPTDSSGGSGAAPPAGAVGSAAFADMVASQKRQAEAALKTSADAKKPRPS